MKNNPLFGAVLFFLGITLMALIFATLPALMVGALLLNIYSVPEHVVVFWVVLTYSISAFALWIGIATLCMNGDDEEERDGYRHRKPSRWIDP